MTHVVKAWAILGLVLSLTAQLSAEYLWILSVIPHLLWVLAGVAILAVSIWRARRPEMRGSALRQAGIVVVAGFLYLPAWWLGHQATERVRFLWNRPAYDRVVAGLAPSTEIAWQTGEGLEYVVDPGPPSRVVFPWPGGIIDNWCGVVFDPTADVLNVNRLAVGTPEWRSAAQTRLFGGDMTSCRELEEPYFFCCFT